MDLLILLPNRLTHGAVDRGVNSALQKISYESLVPKIDLFCLINDLERLSKTNVSANML